MNADAASPAAAIAEIVRRLAEDPTRAELWTVLRRMPLYENAEAAGIARRTPITRSRAPEIVQGLLTELREEGFHAGKLLVAGELARICNVSIPFGEISRTAGVPVLVRPLRVPPQDFDAEQTVRIEQHAYQPWVHTHNRPDEHRKCRHPFTPFVRVPGLQIARTPSQEKPECGFVMFDADHALICPDTMWAGHETSAKMLTPLSMNAVMTFGWTPQETVEVPAVFIPNRENYYHFLMESLPAAVLAVRTPALSDRRLIFSRLSKWQREALRMAGVPEDRCLELENLKPVGKQTDYLRFADAWIPVDPPFALGCAVVRDALPARREMRRGARYFIARGGGGDHVVRRLENENDVVAALANRGFTPVVAERLSFAEQVELFSHAEMIAGPHGAGLTNIVHAPQQATLIELMNASCHNERRMNFSSMQRIAQCDGQNYIRVVGAEAPGVGPEVFPPNRPYTADIGDLLRAVDAAAQPYAHTVYVS